MVLIQGASKIRALKKLQESARHTSRMRTNIPAGMASTAPPLGTMLGQRNIHIANFCKEFNERTANIRPGIPLPTRSIATSDKTFDLDIHMPPATYFIKQAAGISRGGRGDEIAGKITLRHLYEIAMIKIKDPPNALLTPRQMVEMLVGVAKSCGVRIVRNLDAEDYANFLEGRKIIIAKNRAELQAVRDAKMLRAS